MPSRRKLAHWTSAFIGERSSTLLRSLNLFYATMRCRERCSVTRPPTLQQALVAAVNRLRREGLRRGPHGCSGAAGNGSASATVWHFCGFCGPSEDAIQTKTPLCNSWRHGFARSRRDLTIFVGRGGDSSSRFLFREAVSDQRRPGSAH